MPQNGGATPCCLHGIAATTKTPGDFPDWIYFDFFFLPFEDFDIAAVGAHGWNASLKNAAESF